MPGQYGPVPSLDGLRAGSILLVLLAHLFSDQWFPGGFGVLTFFVISGFLITRLLFAEFKSRGTVSLRSFYLRRILRLYPAALAYIGLVTLVYWILVPDLIDVWEPVSALFYFANYLFVYYSTHHIEVTMPFTHFWSLSIEEQFYIAFPALLLLCRGRPAPVLGLAFLACVAALAWRLVGAIEHPELLDTEYFYLRTEMRMDSIAFGVAIAALCELPRGRRLIRCVIGPLPVTATVLMLVACFAYRAPFFRETLRYTLLAGGIALCLCAVLFSARYAIASRILNAAPIVWLGRLSYSLYLWHLAASGMTRPFLGDLPEPLIATFALAASLILAALSYYGLEQPLIGLRHRLQSRAALPGG